MELDFDSYPLNIYSKASSRSLLKSLEGDVQKSHPSRSSISEAILSSFIKKASGVGLLSLIDSISIGFKGEKARRCLSNMIQGQTARVKEKPSSLLKEAQVNLLATSCITGHLASWESASYGNAGKNFGKAVIALIRDFSFKSGLNAIFESVAELDNKYNDICQVYHVAFLLNIYNSVPNSEHLVKQLITESLCDDSEGESSFDRKKRKTLFSDVKYKTLDDNLENRLDILSEESKRNEDLYNPFVKWRINLNEESNKAKK